MKYSPSSRDALDAHCREVIRSCLNIVEQHGDTYVAIHKDDEIDCVVLVSMIRSYPSLSLIRSCSQTSMPIRCMALRTN